MSKLEQNKKQKKDSLLSAAFELFTTKGIHKTSISEIAQNAGVAKGTFYLYFTDKYDIRNKLISKKASLLFAHANEKLQQTFITEFEDRIIFIVDNILDQLNENKSLMNFISKNLSWGIFKSALISHTDREDLDFYSIYIQFLESSNRQFKEPEVMIFMIVELINSACYSPILYQEPVPLSTMKPYLFETVRHIIRTQEILS